jgi:hypothetical protein
MQLRIRVMFAVWLALAAVVAGFAPMQPEAGRNQPADPPAMMLLADTARVPRVEVTWPVESGDDVRLAGDRTYTSPQGKQALGRNVSAYVAMGGTRLDRGASHPKGAVVRVGLYKTDPAKPFFEGIPDGAKLTVRLTNVAMNQPVRPWPATVVMHLKYSPDELAGCGLGGAANALFYTVSRTDTLNGKITPDNGRMGFLDGSHSDGGTIDLRSEPDGSVSLVAVFPYALLRHMKDPWLRTAPGAFVEPNHFHIEFEVLPVAVADAITDPAARPRPYPEPIPKDGPIVGPLPPGR